MKKFLSAVAVAALTATAFVTPAHADQWKAVAIAYDSDPGYYWSGTGTGGSEDSARSRAVAACENASSRTCYETRAVLSWWTLVVANCNGSISTGGSKHGLEAARARAAYNAGMPGTWCKVLKVY